MARVVIFDEVTDYITSYLPSANTPLYEGRSDALIEPISLDALLAAPVPRFDWIHDTGDIREMFQAEKDVRDAATAAARDAAMRAAAKASFDGQTSVGQRQRIIIKAIVDQFNVLRALHSLPSITLAQVKNVISNGIDNGDVDE